MTAVRHHSLPRVEWVEVMGKTLRHRSEDCKRLHPCDCGNRYKTELANTPPAGKNVSACTIRRLFLHTKGDTDDGEIHRTPPPRHPHGWRTRNHRSPGLGRLRWRRWRDREH